MRSVLARRGLARHSALDESEQSAQAPRRDASLPERATARRWPGARPIWLTPTPPWTRTTRLAAPGRRLHRPGNPRAGSRDADVTGRAAASVRHRTRDPRGKPTAGPHRLRACAGTIASTAAVSSCRLCLCHHEGSRPPPATDECNGDEGGALGERWPPRATGPPRRRDGARSGAGRLRVIWGPESGSADPRKGPRWTIRARSDAFMTCSTPETSTGSAVCWRTTSSSTRKLPASRQPGTVHGVLSHVPRGVPESEDGPRRRSG